MNKLHLFQREIKSHNSSSVFKDNSWMVMLWAEGISNRYQSSIKSEEASNCRLMYDNLMTDTTF